VRGNAAEVLDLAEEAVGLGGGDEGGGCTCGAGDILMITFRVRPAELPLDAEQKVSDLIIIAGLEAAEGAGHGMRACAT
jgi:hypothetical protein